MAKPTEQPDFNTLARDIKQWSRELGFTKTQITDIDLSAYTPKLHDWLEKGFHGEMEYMARNIEKRTDPAELHPGTTRVICVAINYLPPNARIKETLTNPEKAFISRYATGADYHKLIRKRLQKLAHIIQEAIGPFGYRAFADSAPVLEKPLAEKAGIGWIGKHTNILSRDAGSWFFLGELFTDLPLPIDAPVKNHCGSCSACIDVCPTQAIIAPYTLDARRCISYLTIELKGSIPIEYRSMLGNRVYGCDDCQLVCPWNRFAKITDTDKFKPRHDLDTADMVDLFLWDEDTFLKKTQGSAIRRIGHESWLRNIAVGLGNAPTTKAIIAALQSRQDHPSALVREHVAWALEEHKKKD